jgi:hypothetical protein
MENNFNFGDQNNFRDIDMFMRLETNFTNMNNEWFSDASGLSMQRYVEPLRNFWVSNSN